MITVFEVQSIKEAEKHEYNGVLLDWIIEHYPNGFSVPTQIYSGGLDEKYLIAEFEEGKSQDKYEFLRLNMRHDNVFIVMQPLGVVEAIAISFLINVATSIVSAILFPPPKLPEGVRAAKTSPNNGVGPQTNTARALNRVPDIFGKDRSYPDLITPGVFEYVDHIKFIEQDFCISRGFGLVEDIRTGETSIDSIVAASYEIYEPGEAPTRLLKPRESNEVKSLTLNPPNESGVLMTNEFWLYDGINYGTISAPPSEIYRYSSSQDTWIGSFESVWDGFESGNILTLSDVYFSSTKDLIGTYIIDFVQKEWLDISGASYFISSGIMEISIDASNISLCKYFEFTGSKFLSDSRLIKARNINSAFVELIVDLPDGSGTFSDGSALFSTEVQLSVAQSINPNWDDLPSLGDNPLITGDRVYDPRAFAADSEKDRGPFIIPGDENAEVWLDIQFPRGLVNDADKSYTVDTEFLFEELDDNENPTGTTFTVNYSYTDNVPDPRFYTEKVASSDGLKANTKYQVTGTRTSNTDVDDTTLLDQCQWTRLVGIENIAGADTTGTTRLKVNTQATEQTSSLQESKINLNWTRKTVTWNGSSVVGDIESGVGLTPSMRMADAALHYALDPELGARNISQIDVSSFYDIQDELDSIGSGELGQFSFTFSNENTPALEELRQIANAARCILIREGSVLSVVRDQAQPVSLQLFNRRNKLPDSERKTITFNKPLDTDGVTLEYKSDEDDEVKIINIPEDLEAGDPNYGNPTPLNPLKVEGTGIRNLIQAWDRAQYEYNKIIYKRETVETTVTGEALLLNLNDRIDHVDGTRIQSKVSEGEVLGVNGFDIDTSEICEFEDGKTYSVIFRNIDGSLSTALPASKRTDTDFGFTLSSSPTLFLRGDNDFQIGSLYSFASDDAQSQSYLVQKITPDSDGNVTLELINYADEYYQADEVTPPGAGRAYSDGYSDGYK